MQLLAMPLKFHESLNPRRDYRWSRLQLFSLLNYNIFFLKITTKSTILKSFKIFAIVEYSDMVVENHQY